MTTLLDRMPTALRHLLACLPAYPGSVLFAVGMNGSVLKHLPSDTLEKLEDRAIRLHARDAGMAFDFTYRNGRFHAVEPNRPVDLTIAADIADFYQTARRQEDPDTLFFSRRLTMEGDTELGLLVKNTLEALDLSLFDPARFFPPRFQQTLPGSLALQENPSRGTPWH